MIVMNLLGDGLFLSAIGAMGLMFAHSKATEASPKQTAAAHSPEAAIDPRIASLRAAHRVTLVSDQDEGYSVGQLSHGVYGFTYTPQEAAPLFGKKMFHNFEVHKLHDGSVHLVGFVTEQAATQLETGGAIEVSLYPDPYEQAVNAVSVPLARVMKTHGPSRDLGNALHLQLEATTADNS
jgi:hypothetical protein